MLILVNQQLQVLDSAEKELRINQSLNSYRDYNFRSWNQIGSDPLSGTMTAPLYSVHLMSYLGAC